MRAIRRGTCELGPEERAWRVVEAGIPAGVLFRGVQHDPKRAVGEAGPVLVGLVEREPEPVGHIPEWLTRRLPVSERERVAQRIDGGLGAGSLAGGSFRRELGCDLPR